MALVDPKQLDLLKPKRKKAKPPKVFDLGWKSSDGVVRFCIPASLVNTSNVREDRWTRGKRNAAQKNAAWVYCKSALCQDQLYRIVNEEKFAVKITRFGPKLLDDDGLAISAKAVRDGIAMAFQVDDSPDAPVTWEYAQEKTNKGYSVGVEVWVTLA